jgi:hypothetical protein
MPAGDDLFCTHYRADPKVRDLIDKNPDDFYVRYRGWEKHGKPGTVDDMVAYFGYWGDAEVALNAGNSSAGNTSGGVAQDDCGAFNAFVALSRHYTYTPAEIAALQTRHALLSNDLLGVTFEAALSKYFKGKQNQLSRLEKALLMARLLCK